MPSTSSSPTPISTSSESARGTCSSPITVGTWLPHLGYLCSLSRSSPLLFSLSSTSRLANSSQRPVLRPLHFTRSSKRTFASSLGSTRSSPTGNSICTR